MTAPTQCDHEAALFAALDEVLSEDLDDADEMNLREPFAADWSEP